VNHKAQGSNWSEGCNAPSAIGLKESKSVKPINIYINLNPADRKKARSKYTIPIALQDHLESKLEAFQPIELNKC
jgi:hypothetical protein